MEPSTIGRLCRAWARGAFTLDLRSLAAWRIALGGVLMADAALRCRDFRLLHTAAGLFPPDAVRARLAGTGGWSLALLHDADAWAASLLLLEAVAGALLALGLWARVAALAGWIAVVSLTRRAPLAANLGDAWLACQLLWASFLPLAVGGTSHLRPFSTLTTPDKVKGFRGCQAPGDEGPATVLSVATVAVVCQLAFVYLGAGLGKCNATWWDGCAVSHALSIHDHGTAIGHALAAGLGCALSPAVPCFEIALAAGVLAGGRRFRALLIALASLFHAAIWIGMSVGLFAPIALAAWLPLIPSGWWAALEESRLWIGSSAAGCGARVEKGQRWLFPRIAVPPPDAAPGNPENPRRFRVLPEWKKAMDGFFHRQLAAGIACGLLLALAAAGFTESVLRSLGVLGRLAGPSPLNLALDLAALRQQWDMFGEVPAQEQWVMGRALLADGREVDILRGGRPCGGLPPEDGFLSLPNYRWRATLQALHEPRHRPLAPGVAEGLVRHWNAARGGDAAVRSFELLFGRRQAGSADTLHELVIATWPPRSPSGGGGLERLLEEQGLQ